MRRMKVKRHKNVSKTRICYRDFGRFNDPSYCGTSGSFYPKSMTRDDWSAWLKNQYAYGVANRSPGIIIPDILGAETINSSSGRRGSMNNCTHIKQRYVCYPVTRAAQQYNRSSYYVFEPFWRYKSEMAYWKDAASVALALGAKPDPMFSARAYWSMRPKFQSEVSLINSIFELKDFSDVASVLFGRNKQANSRVRRISQQAGMLTRAFRSAPVGTGVKLAAKVAAAGINVLSRPYRVVADLSKLAAQGQLTYSLAIMPTIRDVISIHATAQQDVYALAREFKSWGDEGSRSHYSEHEVFVNDLSPGMYNNYCWADNRYVKRTLTATMVSRYRVLWEKLENRYPKWWGLEIGADEVWNMLPLSFVLDYVLTLGKSLEYMDRDETVEILSTEYCESCKVIANSGLHYLQDTRTAALMIDGVEQPPRTVRTPLLVTGTAASYYQRIVKEPYKGPALPKFKAPTRSQTANLLALARCLLF